MSVKLWCIPTLLLLLCGCAGDVHKLSLAGEWRVALDSLDRGDSSGWNNTGFETPVTLPGTTDMARLGTPNALRPEMTQPQMLRLTRNYSYLGAAYYTREIEIPASAAGKRAVLNLERVLWKSDVWVDGRKVEPIVGNSLVAAHRYDLTSFLTPGATHRLTVRVDNRRQFDVSVRELAHAYTNDTQTIWNGMLGDLSIDFMPVNHIRHLAVYPDVDARKATVSLEIYAEAYEEGAEVRIRAVDRSGRNAVAALKREITLDPGLNRIEIDCPMGDDVRLWSEFSPAVYRIEARLASGAGEHAAAADFGMRKMESRGDRMFVNGSPLFLRGTLECCIFPLTGTPPLDREGWRKVIRTAKEWGLNHLRFHSWCPPEAAFEVADAEGLYLQVELPLWALNVGADRAAVDYLEAEADRILRAYGSHPSFCMMSMGNELQGDMQIVNSLMKRLKAVDNRRLYTSTSFTFEPGYGVAPMDGDDFFVTQWTGHGWVRGQGVFEQQPPQFDRDYQSALEGIGAPLITHEIGQYSVYPNLAEIEKYTGVLRPLNFEAVREDLKRKGLLSDAEKYTWASGKLAAILYKEEIERALKTPGISGYQLLDLHDFPGQGTALVGLLDAFWESKGVVSARQFREFCAPVVPLVRYAKAAYAAGELFTAEVDISNYSAEALENAALTWELGDSEDGTFASGTIGADIAQGYNRGLGRIAVELAGIEKARKLTLTVGVEGTSYRNSWSVWVYPQADEDRSGDVRITDDLNTAMAELEKGGKVLLLLDWRYTNGLQGKFLPVFWSPVHFPEQAGTMGLLCDAEHPALADFPNDGHGDWQWWELCVDSRTMVVDSLHGGAPVVKVIDNFTNNRRLAMIYEGRVGDGRLVLASCDLTTDLDRRIVARQMRRSLIRYMKSDRFDPPVIENPEVLRTFVSDVCDSRRADATDIY